MLGWAALVFFWLGGGIGCLAVTQGAAQEDKPPIPPDLLFQFKSVTDEENAVFAWRQADKLKVEISDRLKDIIKYSWTPSAQRPSEEDLGALKSWFRQNEEGLKVFNKSISKAKTQWTEQDPSHRQPEISGLAHFISARLFEADCLASDKKFTNAVESLEDSLKLAQRGIDGDGAFIHYLVCALARSRVQSAMVRMATHRDLPVPLMERLLKDLPSLDSETNSYSQILKVEFTRYAYHTTDLKKLAETYAKLSDSSAALSFYPEELRRPLKVLLDPSLIAIHPKPLDEVAGLNRDIHHFRIFRTNSVCAWTNRDDSFILEDDDIIKELIEDIKPLMDLVKDEPLPLSHQAAERAREAYLQIENPLGRIFSGSLFTFTESARKVFISRTERESARAMLGLLIFQGRNGVLPGKLSDLVDTKIFDSVPRDLFANGPISYSRERRIIWSVGEDAEDNGGKSEDGKFHWYVGDAVWQIPVIN